ncbi:MAG TPA: EAL domain-containing protein, partial [Ilumatobacteraceae bacterium]
NHQLAHQATHDPLTNLFNRRGAIDALERALGEATLHQPVGLLYLDLDRFKQINDTLGHRGGDQFIAVVADRLQRSIDPGATAGRIGGDEFIAVLPNCDLGASMAVASRIASVLSQPVHAEGREVPSSVSIGVAVGPSHGTGTSELLRHANAALHRAKAGGRNRIDIFDGSVKTELDHRLNSEQALRRALDGDDIVAFFQPEIDATTGQVVGAELLARWLRRDGTVSTANEFIGVAAQAGLLERLTDHVMQQARPLIRRLSTLGLPEGFRFRVNLPPRATERSWRENPLEVLLNGIEPTLLTVDVTESAVVDDLAAAAANLASLRVRGVRVCLDDFAKGVSSLSLLRRLPLDEVRIDRNSIDTITAHPHDRAIVRSIIGLVREIGLTATADGVETGAQADVLIALGCIRHQGHLYSRALAASDFDSYLARSMVERFAPTSVRDAETGLEYPQWPVPQVDS